MDTKKKVARLSPELQAAARIDRIMSELDERTMDLVYAWYQAKYNPCARYDYEDCETIPVSSLSSEGVV